MSKNEVLSLCTKLRPPLFIYETSAIDQSLQQVKTRSKLALEDLQHLIKQATAENNLSHKIDDETIQEVITSCEILIGVDLWINLDLNDLANEIIELLAMLEPMRFPTAKRMIETFIPKILEKSIKPIFLKYSKIRSDKRDGRSSKKLLLDHDNMNEPWRGEVAQASSLLHCCVLHMKCSVIETMLGLIVPPMLSLVDDYDIRLKTRGVSILDYLLKEAKPEVIQRSGLGTS